MPYQPSRHAPTPVTRWVRRGLTGRLATRPPFEPSDPGLFGPQSASWQLYGDLAAIPGALAAMLSQTQHPMVMAAVASTGGFRTDPLGRLQRTASFAAEVTFGSTATAHAAARQVAEVHARISGEHLGRTWRADDEDLLDWVHCSLLECLLSADALFAAEPLDDARRDQFVAEQAQVAELLGDTSPPRTHAELVEHMAAFAPHLAVGDDALDAVGFLCHPPVDGKLRATYPALWHGAVAALPASHRRRLHLTSRPGAVPLARASLSALRWGLGPRQTDVPSGSHL